MINIDVPAAPRPAEDELAAEQRELAAQAASWRTWDEQRRAGFAGGRLAEVSPPRLHAHNDFALLVHGEHATVRPAG